MGTSWTEECTGHKQTGEEDTRVASNPALGKSRGRETELSMKTAFLELDTHKAGRGHY